MSFLPPPQEVAGRRDFFEPAGRHPRVTIAATFTADPLLDPLEEWQRQLHTEVQFEFAPPFQLFQQLLSPDSPLTRASTAAGVVLFRWLDVTTGSNPTGHDVVEDLASALGEAVRGSRTPIVAIACPSHAAGTAAASADDARDARLKTAASHVDRLHVWSSAEFLIRSGLSSVPQALDLQQDGHGSVPYGPLLYAACATAIARVARALVATPVKVIVLDADQTLWRGECANDALSQLEVTDGHAALQRWALRQRADGVLLCVCSRNVETDVRHVFRSHPQMQIREADITGWRVNWDAKSVNLQTLASGLGVGLDSVLVLDDNPLECAEMQRGAPGAVVLQVPADAAAIPEFIERIWATDRLTVTGSDRTRAASVGVEAARAEARAQSADLASFFAGLGVQILVEPIRPDQFARAAQLTQRTNQFNTTTQRRSEADIALLAARPDHRVLMVAVRDRFGDYGDVGLAIARLTPETLILESLMLSCRALGRGVEHAMLAHVGVVAQAAGALYVDVCFTPSGRNLPVEIFLDRVAGAAVRTGTSLYRLATAEAAHIRYDAAAESAGTAPVGNASMVTASHSSRIPQPGVADARLFDDIAHGRLGPVRIANSLSSRARSPRPIANAARPAATTLERRLCEAFARHVGVDVAGADDSFFELGGTSLQATLLVNELQRTAGRTFDSVPLFEHETPAALAAYLSAKEPGAASVLASPAVGDVESTAAPAQVSVAGTLAVSSGPAIDLEALDDDEVARLLDALTSVIGRRSA